MSLDPTTAAHSAMQFARALAGEVEATRPTPAHLVDAKGIMAEYELRITDPDLRVATRSRFESQHYADAVEAGVKCLNECVRSKSGLHHLDGDELMTTAFSANSPVLRLNNGKSKSDASEQRGYMHMCAGIVGAWRNPRAHSTKVEDTPKETLMMLETIDHLVAVTKRSVKARKKKLKP